MALSVDGPDADGADTADVDEGAVQDDHDTTAAAAAPGAPVAATARQQQQPFQAVTTNATAVMSVGA